MSGGAAGFIQPNDHVDVMMVRDVDSSENNSGGPVLAKARAHTILQNVKVLAIDSTYTPPAKEGEGGVLIGTRATLELSPEDATLVAAAQKGGKLSVTLRSIADLQGADGATAIGRALRDGARAEQVRIYRYGAEGVAPVPAS